MTTKTILLIHHEANVREVVQVCLSHFGGWRVLSISSPTEGLQCAAQIQPDAIVLDLAASEVDDFMFLKKLRTQSVTQLTPVVLLANRTNWLNSKALQQLQVAGVVNYFTDPTSLAKEIARLLNWSEMPA